MGRVLERDLAMARVRSSPTLVDDLDDQHGTGGPGAWTCVPAKNRVSARPILSVGLLRQLAGQTHQQIALALSLPQSSAPSRARQHLRLMRVDADYARQASELASACLSVGQNP